MRAVWAALQTLLMRSDSDVVRVVGQGPPGADFIEIVIKSELLPEARLREYVDRRRAEATMPADPLSRCERR